MWCRPKIAARLTAAYTQHVTQIYLTKVREALQNKKTKFKLLGK